jgi:hypothetical protein
MRATGDGDVEGLRESAGRETSTYLRGRRRQERKRGYVAVARLSHTHASSHQSSVVSTMMIATAL